MKLVNKFSVWMWVVALLILALASQRAASRWPGGQAPPAEELAGHVREWAVPAPNTLPHDPAVDPRGNIWLTLQRANQVARFNPETAEWKLFAARTPDSGPHGLVADADGNIWFTENYAVSGANKVAVVE